MRTGRRASRGYAYLLLLLAIALIGLAASTTISLGATMARRDAERQLLAIGVEFQQALRSYSGVPLAAAMPVAARGPRSLDDLLKDARVPGLRRHLRQVYADPLTGKKEWGLVTDNQGFIVGVPCLKRNQFNKWDLSRSWLSLKRRRVSAMGIWFTYSGAIAKGSGHALFGLAPHTKTPTG